MLSKGAKAGIAVGAIVVVLLLLLALFCTFCCAGHHHSKPIAKHPNIPVNEVSLTDIDTEKAIPTTTQRVELSKDVLQSERSVGVEHEVLAQHEPPMIVEENRYPEHLTVVKDTMPELKPIIISSSVSGRYLKALAIKVIC